MLKYLIQVVQNSLATAILLAAIFALVHKNGGSAWHKRISAESGAVAGAILALLLAFLKHTTVWINREYWNTGILSVSIVSCAAFIVFLWRSGTAVQPADTDADTDTDAGRRGFFAEPGGVFYRVSAAVLCASLVFYALPDIFLYPTEFVLRDESLFSTDFLFRLIGYSAGLLLVCLTGLALFKAGTDLPDRLRKPALVVGLGVNGIRQIAVIIQFLYARRMIPTSRFLFNILKNIINYNDFFLYALMAAALIFPLAAWTGSFARKEPGSNPAERRKIKAAARRKRRWSALIILGYLTAVFCLTVLKAYDRRDVVLSPAEPMDILGDTVVIPAGNISDGHLHRFIYTASDGTEVRFIVIKKNETTYGVGLDACDICGPTGYYERKDEVVCKLCDVVMNKSTIGFKGGCNPVPLAYTLESGAMVIQTGHLEDEKGRFK
ncbi:MAG: Fe-S-containing protein [Peptococcaceae bacterium]|jgi:uncharacterized membrane protein|nr:Fe-S-containing protein [Peptococcaceae bacterium]